MHDVATRQRSRYNAETASHLSPCACADDASALDSLNEDGARQMQDMLEKLQAQVSATQAILKAKQAELADAAKRA